VIEWARRRGVPEAAALEWRERKRPISKMLVRGDVDVPGWGLKAEQ